MTRPTHMLPRVLDRLSIGGKDACWDWQGPLVTGDYGVVWNPQTKRRERVHRVAHELWRGPILAGLQIDHLCRNRRCANPAHLELVTSRENTLRGEGPGGRHARVTHCPKGHEYTPENTAYYNGKRYCRACDKAREDRRAYFREYNRTRRAALAQDTEQETKISTEGGTARQGTATGHGAGSAESGAPPQPEVGADMSEGGLPPVGAEGSRPRRLAGSGPPSEMAQDTEQEGA